MLSFLFFPLPDEYFILEGDAGSILIINKVTVSISLNDWNFLDCRRRRHHYHVSRTTYTYCTPSSFLLASMRDATADAQWKRRTARAEHAVAAAGNVSSIANDQQSILAVPLRNTSREILRSRRVTPSLCTDLLSHRAWASSYWFCFVVVLLLLSFLPPFRITFWRKYYFISSGFPSAWTIGSNRYWRRFASLKAFFFAPPTRQHQRHSFLTMFSIDGCWHHHHHHHQVRAQDAIHLSRTLVVVMVVSGSDGVAIVVIISQSNWRITILIEMTDKDENILRLVLSSAIKENVRRFIVLCRNL